MTRPIEDNVDDHMDAALRQWADGRRADAPRITMPDVSAPTRDDRRSAKALGAAATIAAIAAGVAVLVSQTPRTDPPGPATRTTRAAGSTTPRPFASDPLPPASGQREWRFQGLAVNVPSSWPANDVRCASPQHDTVLIDEGPVASCSSPVPPDVTWIEFSAIDSTASTTYPFLQLPRATDQRIDLDGLPAQRREGVSRESSSSHRHLIIIAVPRLHAAVTVVAPSEKQARSIAATVHRVPPTPGGPHGILTGTATYTNGHAPVVPASVSAYRNPSNEHAAPVATAPIDASGHFSLTLPPGSYYVNATLSEKPSAPLICVNTGSDTVTDDGISTVGLTCRAR